jgi:hypothetical protein
MVLSLALAPVVCLVILASSGVLAVKRYSRVHLVGQLAVRGLGL